MPQRPLVVRLGWTLRDYAKRVWDNSAEDNVLFLASGIAFNILLAAVPFFLLMVVSVTYILNRSADLSVAAITTFLDNLLPVQTGDAANPAHVILTDVTRNQRNIGVYSAIGFVWFSTRLFGSLRSVLCYIFDIEHDRGIIQGKIFDIKVTIASTMLVVAYTFMSAYLAIATTRGVRALAQAGVRDETMGQLEYWIGRVIAFATITLMFFALYKLLPNRKIRWQKALVAATFSGLLIEMAKNVFTILIRGLNPGSLYEGTMYAIVIVVVWVYYAALLFIIGGEVGQVYELRRVRRMQREVFEA